MINRLLSIRSRRISSLVACFAVSLTLIIGCESAAPGQRVGDLCPEISGNAPDGTVIRLSDFKGKVVLIDFWASWCGPCRMTFPEQRVKLTETYANRPFAVIGVAQEDSKTVGDFLQQNKLPWPNIADGNGGKIGQQWQVNSLPTYILIDHEGIIRGRWIGAGRMSTIWETIDILVKEAEKK